MEAALCVPLPTEALKAHPSKSFLIAIKAIYVTKRLNEVFGVGTWRVKSEFERMEGKMVVLKVYFSIPAWEIEYECYGGNDNPDIGDAYKGAITDAITKIGSWLGIGEEVWMDNVPELPAKSGSKKAIPAKSQAPALPPAPKKHQLTKEILANPERKANMIKWLEKGWQQNPTTFTPVQYLLDNGWELVDVSPDDVLAIWCDYMMGYNPENEQ